MIHIQIVCRLTGDPNLDGKWVVIRAYPPKFIVEAWPPVGDTILVTIPEMVGTGSVEWDGDDCAEVFVPSQRLDEWRAEHQTD